MAATEQVIGVLSPRSVGGVSIFEAIDPITDENVTEFQSDPSDVAEAANELAALGFEVLNVSPLTVSFGGPQKLFTSVFGAKLTKKKAELSPTLTAEVFEASPEEAERLLEPPQALAASTEGVAITRPPQLYESPLPPIAQIDPAAYRYFFAPDDLAVMLRASRVHRLGTTGTGVVVAMIDSGHYQHPFFTWHGYRVLSTLLGPGASGPGDDLSGHGTGESANVFAAAPDVRLRPIKGLADPVGSFNVAVSSAPKPQIITCSWGYDADYQSWAQLKKNNLNDYNFLKLLEAAVANAVAAGIVVCFAAGNGQRGFPGSHPQVISVGGVHVNYPNLDLEASSYASSFASKLYPGRRVPDLCGLTGERVTVGGAARAPSVMLPVQEGSNLDKISPTTGANNDGWGIFSGTSAACPQVAGVAALMLQKNPALTPAQVKQKLMDTARDVKAGTSAHGETAGPGVDNATGAGLVDAKWSFLVSMADVAGEFMTADPDKQQQMMESGQFPKVPTDFIADMINALRTPR